MSDNFDEKLSALRSSINNIDRMIDGRNTPVPQSCVSIMTIVAIIVPIIILLMLFFIQPSFVQKKDGRKYVRSGWKTTLWTIILTAVVWLGMYLFTFCKGYAKNMICWN